MQDLRVADIRALSDIGANTFLEVRGKLVMRHGRRLYDHANHPDPMMDLEDASVRFHTANASTPWQPAAGLSVNRDQVVLLAPRDKAEASIPNLRETTRDVMLNLICGPLQVAGTVALPLDATITGFVHQSPTRFLALANPRIRPHLDGLPLGDFHDGLSLCYVNASRINVCLEAKREARPGSSFVPQ